MEKVLSDMKYVDAEAFSARRCIFELNDKKINPYHLIKEKMNEIENIIKDIPCISDVKKRFYCTIIKRRFDKVLSCVYEMIKEFERKDIKVEGRCR